eukprot:CAMPEP_0179702648 /NCGR_PEP_ID=MMETSP0937-20121108/2385_1 /TAXON_ID=548131 ORGANISM="Ostreococcus mediterraneus, Strain clade-D-RCC2593" /NCGR_SAMPLE_ID=MMETSP0937 /ASSEMBLY_ACC=CAM_ASM_000575 /LENGTH=315 /DNA_ID=CAMNT_0021575787 /DNA_START=630 /DNA_END=1577 /DNA_ORIENTATION=-
MILIAPTRYEVGRTDSASWSFLNENLRLLASNPRNVIAANNRYDSEYIRHFSGIQHVELLPNLCEYVHAVYRPTSKTILIGPSRLSKGGVVVLKDLIRAIGSVSSHYPRLRFATVREMYPKFNYAQLAQHPAVVLLPYQISIMSIIEYYRMGIPLFAPSVNLLIKWQVKYLIMDELSWNCVRNSCKNGSSIRAHPDSPHGNTDPNNIMSERDLAHWLVFADFYQWPAITYFDSWKDLFEKLNSSNLHEIHMEMMKFNKEQKHQIILQWKRLLQQMFSELLPRKIAPRSPTRGTWDETMADAYPLAHFYRDNSSCR